MDFPTFDEVEWVRYVLSRIQGEFIWLDRPYKITEEVIKNVTCLHKIEGILGTRCKLSHTEMNKFTDATFDGRSMRVDDVKDIDVKFAAMVIGYKVVQPRTIWIMPMGYEVEEATQHLLQAPVDEKEEKFGTAKEKGLKVHQEQVAPAIQKKMTRLAVETLISEGVDRSKVEQHVKILEEHRKKELKQKRKEEREARKVAQATPNVVPVTSETSKQPEAKPASQTPEVPKEKYVFARVVREKKEEQKFELVKETPQRPKITIVHKRKPKLDEQAKSESKRRTSKKKMNAQDLIEQIVNDSNLDISSFFDNFGEEDNKQIEEAILLYLDSFSRALIELEKVLPKELFDRLERQDVNKDTGAEDTQVLGEAPSGKATGAQELKDTKVVFPVDKGKETVVDLSSNLACDTSAIAKGNLSQLSISFDKPYHKMSPTEKILAATVLQAQATQELAQAKSKDKKLIEHSFEVLNQLVLEFQAQDGASSSGKLEEIIDFIPKHYDSLLKISLTEAKESFVVAQKITFLQMIEMDKKKLQTCLQSIDAALAEGADLFIYLVEADMVKLEGYLRSFQR
ncbi:uncharacterized protein LOC131876008 [Cryptomeria japonica]|uniref:uncharacterized protein LOC131876008 n=1 Tax=Cryptomeria japonica TaxID=3369 RepID=UPI0027DA9C8F|nr:uncharacterized protein LOC131876008 [Cryptomeria japonica]